ncbi:MAG: glycosyltransferase [Candidatus Binatia bacterium]|nr:glycosyltransferase [Candidatus Binatia bacterium]
MRILQVVHGLPPSEWGGAELVTLHLAQALRARGHEVTILARTAGEGEEFALREEWYEGIQVVRVRNTYTQHVSFRLFYDNTFFHLPFLRLLEQIRPEVIHFQHLAHLSVNLLPLAAALGYPTILSLHDFFFPCERIHLIDRELRRCPGPDRGERCIPCLQEAATAEEVRRRFVHMERVLQVADSIVTPSQFLAERMTRYFPVLQGRLQMVPLGVKAVPRSATQRTAGEPLRLLCVGVLMPHKGAHVLVAALQGLPPHMVQASLYGGIVPFWQGYVEQVRDAARGVSVRFCGSYTHDQLATIVAQHDVLVVPSLCEETFSLVTREALTAGLPVVAARHGALLEVIEDGVNGLFFAPGDAADLRRCVWRLLTEPGLLARLRTGAVETPVKSLEAYAEEIERVYREVSESEEARIRQRLARVRQVVAELSAENAVLRQEHARLQQALRMSEQERQRLQQERDQLQREQQHTLTVLRYQEEALRVRERALEEQHARLAAIYASTTWKLYRGYAFLQEMCVRHPLRLLRQWLKPPGGRSAP